MVYCRVWADSECYTHACIADSWSESSLDNGTPFQRSIVALYSTMLFLYMLPVLLLLFSLQRHVSTREPWLAVSAGPICMRSFDVCKHKCEDQSVILCVGSARNVKCRPPLIRSVRLIAISLLQKYENYVI